ncbi:hypothetical protein BV20DRAFT_971807 [Pilatotrama ljubarskyi]|nr:hypothetical protein BV20DRAFT_971807 [Pilatotrama ljubarskyi]
MHSFVAQQLRTPNRLRLPGIVPNCRPSRLFPAQVRRSLAHDSPPSLIPSSSGPADRTCNEAAPMDAALPHQSHLRRRVCMREPAKVRARRRGLRRYGSYRAPRPAWSRSEGCDSVRACTAVVRGSVSVVMDSWVGARASCARVGREGVGRPDDASVIVRGDRQAAIYISMLRARWARYINRKRRGQPHTAHGQYRAILRPHTRPLHCARRERLDMILRNDPGWSTTSSTSSLSYILAVAHFPTTNADLGPAPGSGAPD